MKANLRSAFKTDLMAPILELLRRMTDSDPAERPTAANALAELNAAYNSLSATELAFRGPYRPLAC